jgi:hypothetical protein
LYARWSCGELEVDLDAGIQDVVGSLNFTWMLQFKMRVLFFGVDLSYMFNFCTFTTSSFANVALGFVFHIHFQSSNIYMHRVLHFEIHWDLVFFFFSFFWNLLKSVVGIEIWFWNLLLSLNFKFKRF